MKDIFDEYFPAKLTEEQVLNEIMEEVNNTAEHWAKDVDKFDYYCAKAVIMGDLQLALTTTHDPAIAALNAFKLAALISQVSGPKKLKEVIQRHDAMSVEIDEVIAELERSGRKPKAIMVWKELFKRCGQPGSCCIRLENDPVSDKQKIVWGGPGGAVQRMGFYSLQGRLGRKNRC